MTFSKILCFFSREGHESDVVIAGLLYGLRIDVFKVPELDIEILLVLKNVAVQVCRFLHMILILRPFLAKLMKIALAFFKLSLHSQEKLFLVVNVLNEKSLLKRVMLGSLIVELSA